MNTSEQDFFIIDRKKMTGHIIIPPDMSIALGSERKDFVIKAKRAKPAKKYFYIILFSLLRILFTLFFVSALGPSFLSGEAVSMTINSAARMVGPEETLLYYMPILIVGLFSLVGMGGLIYGLCGIFVQGGYFAATPERLVSYRKGKIKSLPWKLFSGKIEVDKKKLGGNISLELKTGRMVHKKRGRDYFLPDIVYLTGISNVIEIASLCRKRIEEHINVDADHDR